jgi:RHS repeat-associated protein
MYAKDLQNDHHRNWYDYGARYYDSSLARFLIIDPKSETYLFQSNYTYAKNNPIYFFEVLGLGPGPFSGRAYKISGGVRVYRITKKQRMALNIHTASFIAFGGWAGNLANATNSLGGFVFEGLFGGTKKVSETLAKDPVVGPNRKMFFKLSKNIKIVKSIINVGSVLKEVIDNKPTKQEILENTTFQFATHLMSNTNINIVNSGLLDIYNDNADPKTIEYGLNKIYNTLETKTSSFDLSTDKGVKEAFEYLKKNYSDIVIDIKNNYENSENNEK